MSFESIQFAIFLPIVFALYWAAAPKRRWIVLFAANIVFYAYAGIRFLLILLYVCAVTFFFSRLLIKHRNRWLLAAGVTADLLPLLLLKYAAFFQENLNHLLKAAGSDAYIHPLQLLLPLGISFYSLSAAAYIVDSYKGKIDGDYSFLQVMTGISFFPCLIAGPIERQQRVLPQMLREHSFDYDTAVYGLKRIAFGLFKKLVIADTIAVPVNKMFSNIHEYHGLELLAAAVFFSIELYCDFSGYSDISIGIARLFGIELMENFKSPFLSRSYGELWRKWHISLSSWFRDYVYIPLGGSRKGKVRKAINTMVVFLISGLWHGAAWTYVIWGGLNGAVQIAESMLPKRESKDDSLIIRVLESAAVFGIFAVLFTFFRANTVSDALFILGNMFRGIMHPAQYAGGFFDALGMTPAKLIIMIGEILILIWYDLVSMGRDPIQVVSSRPIAVRWTIYIVFVLLIAQLSYKGAAVEFIYAAY